MRILLFGEYSRFHNSLKEGLTALGHQVVLAGNNDFKNYPLDISLYPSLFKDIRILNKFRQFIYRLSAVDLAEWETAVRFYLKRSSFKEFDQVQLVNTYPVGTSASLEQKILKYIFDNNTNVTLSACGDDYISVTYMLSGKFRYSTLTPCLNDPKVGHCKYSLLYVTPAFKKLHDYVYSRVNAVIPGDLDYSIPWYGVAKSHGLIPYPVNIDKLLFTAPDPKDGPIVIFHGINDANYHKKGNGFFEKALHIIKEKYGVRVNIITARSLPYPEYLNMYGQCHILLDQTFSYDQGYNALEAMAQGKVVFTGAESAFYEHFDLTERVAINALPDVDSLVGELAFLIENPHEITIIANRARSFIEKEHHYIKIADRYLEVWRRAAQLIKTT